MISAIDDSKVFFNFLLQLFLERNEARQQKKSLHPELSISELVEVPEL